MLNLLLLLRMLVCWLIINYQNIWISNRQFNNRFVFRENKFENEMLCRNKSWLARTAIGLCLTSTDLMNSRTGSTSRVAAGGRSPFWPVASCLRTARVAQVWGRWRWVQLNERSERLSISCVEYYLIPETRYFKLKMFGQNKSYTHTRRVICINI